MCVNPDNLLECEEYMDTCQTIVAYSGEHPLIKLIIIPVQLVIQPQGARFNEDWFMPHDHKFTYVIAFEMGKHQNILMGIPNVQPPPPNPT